MPFTVKTKMFYGWWIVIAGVLTSSYVSGVIFWGFTAIFEPIANDMGWSYAQVSLATSVRGFGAVPLAPVVGILADRWGPRRLISFGAVSTILGLLLLSQTTSLGMFYGAFILIALGMSFSTMTVLMTAVANWFHQRLGIASGIVVSGFGFGGLLLPLIVKLIETYEWRTAIVILAVGMLVTVVPLALVFRHKPEQYGHLPDGRLEDTVLPDDSQGALQAVKVEITTKQALKSSTLWHIALAYAVHSLLMSAIVTHVMPYLSSIGIARAVSSLVATAVPLTSVAGRLGFGFLADKFERRPVSSVGFAMMGLGALFFGLIANAGTWLFVPFIILFGIGSGGADTLRPYLTREYFGRNNFGTVFGLVMGISMLGGIIGPPLAGWVYDNWGNYQAIWFIYGGVSIAAMASVLTTHPIKALTESKGNVSLQ